MDNDTLTCLMRARDTMDVSSRTVALMRNQLSGDLLFAAGLTCADLLNLIDQLFIEFEKLFAEQIAAIGPRPATPKSSYQAEEMLDIVADYFLECRQYLGEIGERVAVDVSEPEITDQDLWEFTSGS